MIEDLGGVITDIENRHLQVYVIDGVAYLGDDRGWEVKLNSGDCRRLRNLLVKAERRVP